MNKLSIATLLSIILAINAFSAERVNNFVLQDHEGVSYELYYNTKASYVLIAGSRAKCQSTDSILQQLIKLKQSLRQDLVAYVLDTTPAAQYQAEDQLVFVLEDPAGLVASGLGLKYAADFVLIDTKNWQVIRRTIESERSPRNDAGSPDALGLRTFDLKKTKQCELLDESRTQNLPDYSTEIAPLLVQHCAHCHRPNGVAPWAMTSYSMVLGFSPMIEEVILTRRMPPWHADPDHGSFKEDISLTVEEKRDLIAWIRGGSPRGSGPDPLGKVTPQTERWTLGEPDVILSAQTFELPATGVIEYQYPAIENPLTTGRWIRAVEILPGDRSVLHHAIVGYSRPQKARDDWDAILSDNHLMTYIPGFPAIEYPDETGLYLPSTARIVAQFHYTTNGKPTTDETKIGLHFSDRPPKFILRHHAMIDPLLRIPPFSPKHEDSVYWTFSKPAILYGLFPHAHYRGRSSKFEIVHSDGSKQILLSVPRYDFNWQRYYSLDQPIEVAIGDKLIYSAMYDNSRSNLRNPNPARTVTWGLQSWDEMLYGAVLFRYLSDVQELYVDPLDFRARTIMGYMDEDMDGVIEPSEMSFNFEMRLAPHFGEIDFREEEGMTLFQLRKILTKVSITSPL